MTLDRDPIVGREPTSRVETAPRPHTATTSNGHADVRGEGMPGPGSPAPELLELPFGRVVSFRFMRLALRRRRKVWLVLALVGLVVGAAFGVRSATDASYDATSTLYLAQPANTDHPVAAQDDLAMLQTGAVGDRAIALLGIHHLTSAALLGETPGTLASDDVLVVTISGPTPKEAVERVNAVARAYLSFRSQRYAEQIRAVIAGATGQIAQLTAQQKAITARIDALGGTRNQISSLIAQRGTISTQIVNLQETIHQDALDTLTVAKGSKVITPGTLVPFSKKKKVLIDAGSGLGIGLALGIAAVLLIAVLSDRLRRRADVAEVLGAPVSLSLPRPRAHAPGSHRRTPSKRAASRMLVAHLGALLRGAGGDPQRLLVVAVDEADAPAAAVAALCQAVSAAGSRVVAVDATSQRRLGRALGSRDVGSYVVDLGGASPAELVVLGAPWEECEDPPVQDDPGEGDGEMSVADAVIVLATIDLGVGAAQLRPWASRAVMSLRAGAASAQRVDAVARTLESAGIHVASAILLDADEDDETPGTLDRRPLDQFQVAGRSLVAASATGT